MTRHHRPDRGGIAAGMLVLALALSAVVPVGCRRIQDSPAVKAAARTATDWATLVDRGDYSASWNAAGSTFRAAVTPAEWERAARAARAPLGALARRSLVSGREFESLPGAPDGHYVVLQFQSSFERKQQAVETITAVRESGGEWRIAGYYIR